MSALVLARSRLAPLVLACAVGLSAAGVQVACAAPVSPAHAATDTLRLSLDDAVREAVARGEEMRSAAADIEEASGRVTEAMSAALPQLTASLNYTRRLDSIFRGVSADSGLGALFSQSSFGAVNGWYLDVTASQLLFSGGRVGAAWKAARDVRRAADAGEREAAGEVTWRVKTAYYDAVLARSLVEIAEAGLEQSRALLRDVDLGYRQGYRAEYDLLRAQVDVANQEPPLVSARNASELALLNLKTLVNVPLDRAVLLTTPLTFEGDLVPVPSGPIPPPSGRAALVAAEAEMEARGHLVTVERGAGWPDLTASTTIQQQAFPERGLPDRAMFRRNWEASLQLNVPIFTGLRTRGAVTRARAEYHRARVRRDLLAESVALEAEGAKRELERTRALLAARRETVRWAERAHDIANVRYRSGIATQLEVSDARLQLQSARVNEVQAARDYLVALAGLSRAAGAPIPVTMKTISELPAPPENGRGQ